METKFIKIFEHIESIDKSPSFLENVIHYLQFRLGNEDQYEHYLNEAIKSKNASISLSSMNSLACKNYANCDFASCLKQKKILKDNIEKLIQNENEDEKESDAQIMLKKTNQELEHLEKMIDHFKKQMANP